MSTETLGFARGIKFGYRTRVNGYGAQTCCLTAVDRLGLDAHLVKACWGKLYIVQIRRTFAAVAHVIPTIVFDIDIWWARSKCKIEVLTILALRSFVYRNVAFRIAGYSNLFADAVNTARAVSDF